MGWMSIVSFIKSYNTKNTIEMSTDNNDNKIEYLGISKLWLAGLLGFREILEITKVKLLCNGQKQFDSAQGGSSPPTPLLMRLTLK